MERASWANIHCRVEAQRFAPFLALIAAACGDSPTGIIVKFSSSLTLPPQTPPDINVLSIKVLRGARPPFEQSFRLGDGASAFRLPADLGLMDETGRGGIFTLEVEGEIGRRTAIKRKAIVTVPQSPTPPVSVPIELNRECLGARCEKDARGLEQTCIPGYWCTDPTFPTGPSRRPSGPPCECHRYFPICVGAFWRYRNFTEGGRTEEKSWSISQHGPIGSGGELGFVQFFNGNDAFSNKWVTPEVIDGSQVMFWRREEWFDQGDEPSRVVRYDPKKLRLDERRLKATDMFEELRYRRFEWLRPHLPTSATDVAPTSVEQHRDRWEVVTFADLPGRRKNDGLASELMTKAVCHKRTDEVLDDKGDVLRSERKVFCFAQGVGKIYEHDITNQVEEVLFSAQVPPCIDRVAK